MFHAGANPVADLELGTVSPERQNRMMSLMRSLDRHETDIAGTEDKVESAIANYELAFRMQTAVPELVDIKGETEATRKLYGLDDETTRIYGQQCLVARRMVERGVRFIELLCPKVGGDRWDQHGNLKEGHENNARAIDRPIAGVLKDLKSRGLLDSTLVVWTGEFGRTPMAQGTNGRDHNPFGFSMWLAGGGIKGGTIYGATDDYGYYAVENKVTVHDMHATMLHLLGIDHKRLTYRFSGRDMRLTDVYGEVVKDILA
jgi:membrane-anchored protein YejM (alkaline phosphatase superfamily)